MLGYALSLARQFAGLRPDATHEVLRQMQQSADDPLALALLGAVAVIGAPVAEEVMFRGVVQTGLIAGFAHLAKGDGRAVRWSAILLTAAGFAWLHEPWSRPLIFALAVGLGWAYERHGSLWVPVTLHVAFNGFNTLLALTAARAAGG